MVILGFSVSNIVTLTSSNLGFVFTALPRDFVRVIDIAVSRIRSVCPMLARSAEYVTY
jgi:hypothetical protein